MVDKRFKLVYTVCMLTQTTLSPKASRFVIQLADGQVLGKVKGGRKMRPMTFDAALVCIWNTTVPNIVAGLEREICSQWPGSVVADFDTF